jgi:hypothetical protein
MNYRFAILLAVVLLAVPVAIAQGILPFSTQAGGPVSSIDLASSNIVLRIPVRNKIGKIPFSYSLVANSSPTGDANGPITLTGQLAGSGQVHYSLTTKYSCEGGYSYTYGNFYYTDVTGAAHLFPSNLFITMGPTTACSGGSIDATSTDGTGYNLIASGGIGTNPTVAVYDKSGNNVTNGLITDPDGASITLSGSSYKDTLGQTALTITTDNGPRFPTRTLMPMPATTPKSTRLPILLSMSSMISAASPRANQRHCLIPQASQLQQGPIRFRIQYRRATETPTQTAESPRSHCHPAVTSLLHTLGGRTANNVARRSFQR